MWTLEILGNTVEVRIYHRGISYAVTKIATGNWEWSIFPPASVKGFIPKSGQIAGGRDAAVEAAKREIEMQMIYAAN